MQIRVQLDAMGWYLAALLTLAGFWWIMRVKERNLLPPGPKGKPLIGNLLDLPGKQGWEYLQQQHAKYGSLVSLNMAGQVIISVGSVDMAHKVFNIHNAATSSRPYIYSMWAWDKDEAFIRLADTHPGFNKSKRMFKRLMAGVKNLETAPIQDFEIKFSMVRLCDGADFWDEFARFPAAALMSAMYGVFCKDTEHPWVERIHRLIELAEDLSTPANYPLLNAFPFLDRVLPNALAPWREPMRLTLEAKGALKGLYKQGVSNAQKTGMENWASITSAMPEFQEIEATSAKLSFITIDLFGAGSDTTMLTLRHLVMAMLRYPKSFAAARAELDAVVGDDRSPRAADLKSLPQVVAVYRELLRWKTIVPLSVPHMMSADALMTLDKGQQVLLPKGAWVLPNLYTMDQDPNRFSRPEDFDPLRHFDALDQLKPDETVAFGMGKRRCVGEAFAAISVQGMIAHMIWLFDVQRKEGDTTELDEQTYGDFTASMPRFQVQLAPRSAHRRDLAKADLDQLVSALPHVSPEDLE